MEKIRAASEEELTAIATIETSIADIDAVAQENSQTAEQTARGSGNLRENSLGTVQVAANLESILNRLLGKKTLESAGEPPRRAALPQPEA